ncbi:hypothetical protein C1H46_041019 [Malus baccata]|uniref:WAT1-related protein n=1 Tax=Malus baccata TaxID=106549 RepID=A0A540KGV1_MALBA|nr:hypothetical protein C1H46_041019 [Malus baccata]
MVLAQIGYTFLYLITAASFDHGMNPHVFVTYRHIVGGLVMFPFAYFLERKVRPKLTLAVFLEIFLLSLLGVSLTLNLYFASLKYTSPTFVTSVANTIPSITFIIAVILRMEAVDVRNPRGIAKIFGTLISLAGAMTMTLYKGPAVRSSPGAPKHITTQSAVFTVTIQHKRLAWSIRYNNDFWSIIYAGVVCSGITVFIQLWCTKQKGPVFVTMFSPLATVLVAVTAYFILGERLHVGRILGAVIITIGLYMVLWGKDRDQNVIRSQEQTILTSNEQMKPKIQTDTSTGSSK